jgi:hypothetical protein
MYHQAASVIILLTELFLALRSTSSFIVGDHQKASVVRAVVERQFELVDRVPTISRVTSTL